MEYSYSFKSGAHPSSWASAVYYNSLKTAWKVSFPEDRDTTIENAKKSSFADLKMYDQICNRLVSNTESKGSFKAEGVFKIDNHVQYTMSVICNKKGIKSYFKEDGGELVSQTHDNYDSAIDSFLNHIA